MKIKSIFLCAVFCLFWQYGFTQNSITGTLVDAETGEPLISANVSLKGTEAATLTNLDGSFKMMTSATGSQTVVFEYLGYEWLEKSITVSKQTAMGKVPIKSSAIGIGEIKVLADVAIDRKTPVAVSTISSQEIEEKLGNQEFPEILKATPSIYATKSSGGFGDARVNIRGFAQEDVALMINGIPVNGMEDNKVYWSNWAGLGDVTRTIQVQRGLGASKLSVASVGGTINIITKSTDMEKGGSIFTSIGNDGYRKTGLTLSTGLTQNNWALTFSGSRTTGNGYIENNYIDAWNYFLSISKQVDKRNLLMLTGFGSPQRHGQRSFMHGIDDQKYTYGTRWNDDYGVYKGKDYNFRDNFYHKPQFGLSHIFQANSQTSLTTSAYLSVGRGGGTGDIGGLVRGDGVYRGREFRQARDPFGHFQFDEVFKYQSGLSNNLYDTFLAPVSYMMADSSTGSARIAANGVNGLIKRASMNEHQWFGIISNASHQLNERWNLAGGVDLRWYTGSHYRKTIDLLGAEYWFDNDNVNDQKDWVDFNGNGIVDSSTELGNLIRPANDANRHWGTVDESERIDYYNDEDIHWYGASGQVEYTEGQVSAFLSLGGNVTRMRRHDFFSEYADSGQTTDWLSFTGGNVKIGANYNIDDWNNIFVNLGLISRAPYFDALFPTFDNDAANQNAENEKVQAIEVGYGFRNSAARVNLNGYYTKWQDKTTVSDFEDDSTGEIFYLNLLGVDALHVGFEIDGDFRVHENLGLWAMASFGDWQWKNDPTGSISNESNEVIGEEELYIDGLKVSDAAQTTIGLGADIYFTDKIKLDVQHIFFNNLYAAYDPTNRDDSALIDVQALKLPSYGLTDLGFSWGFPIGNFNASARINVNNLFNVQYISDAVDNPDPDIGDDRNAEGYEDAIDNTRGWFGFGRTWNASLKLHF